MNRRKFISFLSFSALYSSSRLSWGSDLELSLPPFKQDLTVIHLLGTIVVSVSLNLT